MSIGKQLLKNIFTSWAGFGLRVVLTFFFTPYITSVLGEMRYGAWVIIFATLDYLSMADIGMKQALVRFISKALGEKRMDEVNKVLNTASGIYVLLASIVLVLALLIVYNLELIIDIPDPALLEETRSALLVISFQLTVFFLLLPFASTLGAFHRFDISNAQQMVAETVQVGTLVYLLSQGYGLVSLVWAIFIISMLRQIWSIIVLKRIYPEIKFSYKMYERDVSKRLLGYSKISFLITIMWLIIFRADSYILGGILTVAAAGVYAPASQLFQYIRNMINAVGTPLVPAISHLETTNTFERLSEIYLKGIKYISFLTALFAVGCLFYARSFVNLWLDPAFAKAGDVMMVLSIPAAIFLPQIIGNSILFGVERHKKLLQVLIAEATLKVGLSIYLVSKIGLMGLAYGSGIPQLILYGLIFPHIMKREVKVPVLRTYLTMARSMLFAALVAVPVSYVMQMFLPPNNWLAFFVNVITILLLAAPVGYYLVEPDDRERFMNLIKRR